MNWQIAGHKQQLDFLEKIMASGQLPHALLFAGPDAVGKRSVAYKFAAEVLQTGDKSFDPDFLEIDGRDGIKIEQIRELAYKLALKPYAAPFKVAVIDAAEQMTEEAGNGLLKVLEEPKPYTIVILITSNPSSLPKTIVSRTQKISFGLVPAEELTKLLPPKLSAKQKNLIEILAAGRPGLALQIASDEEFLSTLELNEKKYELFVSSDLPSRLILAAEISDLETPEIDATLASWLLHLVHDFRASASVKTKQLIEQVVLAQKFLAGNVNSKLLLSNLMINT